jgi:hypothetical protein
MGGGGGPIYIGGKAEGSIGADLQSSEHSVLQFCAFTYYLSHDFWTIVVCSGNI